MSEPPDASLTRSREELAAAQLLIDNGFPAQAVSRAYYAAFYAAEAALLRIGQVRSKHAGVTPPSVGIWLPSVDWTLKPARASRPLNRMANMSPWGLTTLA